MALPGWLVVGIGQAIARLVKRRRLKRALRQKVETIRKEGKVAQPIWNDWFEAVVSFFIPPRWRTKVGALLLLVGTIINSLHGLDLAPLAPKLQVAVTGLQGLGVVLVGVGIRFART